MTKKNTNTALIEVRSMLRNLLTTEGNDRLMRARLVVSLAMINAMIAAHRVTKTARTNICATGRRSKSR